MISLDVLLAQIDLTALLFLFGFLVMTIGITVLASRKMSTRKEVYTAGGRISSFNNGLALTGDYISAASLLGISTLVYQSGFDGLLYAIGFLMGWPLVTLLIAGPLKHLGRYTLADMIAARFQRPLLRQVMALGSLLIICFYLVAQMVSAGELFESLFGLSYSHAVLLVGFLMMIYVACGGMLATTWIQVLKAVLLLFGATGLVLLSLHSFGFSLTSLITSALHHHPNGRTLLQPGTLFKNPLSTISLGIGLMAGTAGLPHILMRFFTVRTASDGYRSILYATLFIGYFYCLTCLLGLAAISLLPPQFGAGGGPTLTGNHIFLDLARFVGGPIFYDLMAALTFSTILAVVAGLTLAGAATLAHDLWIHGFRAGVRLSDQKEVRILRLSAILLGLVAMALGFCFRGYNAAFLVGLAFALAASVNFPLLILTLYWSKMTSRGALGGSLSGLIVFLILVGGSKTVWVTLFHFQNPLFPYEYPAIFSMTAAFLGSWIFSTSDRSAKGRLEREGYLAYSLQAETGIELIPRSTSS